jgi:hypothetical protein
MKIDILWAVLGDGQSVLSASDILSRLHQHVPREESGGDQAAYLCNGRRGLSESRGRGREPKYIGYVSAAA